MSLKVLDGLDICRVQDLARELLQDGILEWILGIRGGSYFCTMMGARPHIVPYSGRMSLAKVSEYLGIGAKGTEVFKALGKERKNFTVDELAAYMDYCVQDVRLCRTIYHLEIKDIPPSEQYLIALTLRKYIRPQLELDEALLALELADEREVEIAGPFLLERWLEEHVPERKEKVLFKTAMRLGVAEDDLKKTIMSNNQLAELLRSYGVEPPLKISPRTGKQTFAFAKTDEGMKALAEHENPDIRAIAAVRLGIKSTQVETRLQRFLDVAKTPKKFAIPLLYYGAHTGRFSGFDALNLQNLPRGGMLRKAITAPEGHQILAVDLSQIEARVCAFICNESWLMDAFASGDDVYRTFGAGMFSVPEHEIDTDQRFLAKMSVLGLQFQMSAPRFFDQLSAMGSPIPLAKCYDAVDYYRGISHGIVQAWRDLQSRAIPLLARHPDDAPGMMRWGPVTIYPGFIALPNGMKLHYPDLKKVTNEEGRESWQYMSAGKPTNLYGGKLLENIVQALARIILTRAELSLAKRGVFAAMSVHDELIFVVPDDKVQLYEHLVTLAMTGPVPWLSGIPLEAEGSTGPTYADAK